MKNSKRNEKQPSIIRNRHPVNKAIPIFVLSLAIAISAGCKNSNFPENGSFQKPVSSQNKVFALGPGDSISIRVYGHDDLSGTYNVDDTGRVSLPLILGVNTRGLTLAQLEKKITAELTKNFIVDPKVSIDLVESRPFCILGEVRNPGCFNGIHGMNTVQGIAIAGGYTYRAYKEKFVVTREDGRKIVANSGTPIFAGDTIEVFERYY